MDCGMRKYLRRGKQIEVSLGHEVTKKWTSAVKINSSRPRDEQLKTNIEENMPEYSKQKI